MLNTFLDKMSVKTYNYINIFTFGLFYLGTVTFFVGSITLPWLWALAFIITTSCIFELLTSKNENISYLDNSLLERGYKNIEPKTIKKFFLVEFISRQIWKLGVFILIFSIPIGYSIATIVFVLYYLTWATFIYKEYKSKKLK